MSKFTMEEILAKAAIKSLSDFFSSAVIQHSNTKNNYIPWVPKHDFFNNAAMIYSRHIIENYGHTKSIGMTESMSIEDLYVAVNILDRSKTKVYNYGNSHVDIEKIINNGFAELKQHTIPVLDIINSGRNLYILGSPGSGKTTLLKHTAISNILTNGGKLPVIVALHNYSQYLNKNEKGDLLSFIFNQFDAFEIPPEHKMLYLYNLFSIGKCIFMFDGLDEVNSDHAWQVRHDIGEFVKKFTNNQFLITCRIAASDFIFEKFVDVIVANFNNDQIEKFINNWFSRNEHVEAHDCINKLFSRPRINELATSPLLLSLICIAYEEELDFPDDKSDLYDIALSALIRKWDSSRGISRDKVYKEMTSKNKDNLFRSIAWETFINDHYLIKENNLLSIIYDFVSNLPEFKKRRIDLDAKIILKSSISQHGIFTERFKRIYSFSHLTFHEFFVAKHLCDDKNILNDISKKHATDVKWREVFLLVFPLLQDAGFLIKNILISTNSFASNRNLYNYLDKPLQDNAHKTSYICLIVAIIFLEYVNRAIKNLDISTEESPIVRPLIIFAVIHKYIDLLKNNINSNGLSNFAGLNIQDIEVDFNNVNFVKKSTKDLIISLKNCPFIDIKEPTYYKNHVNLCINSLDTLVVEQFIKSILLSPNLFLQFLKNCKFILSCLSTRPYLTNDDQNYLFNNFLTTDTILLNLSFSYIKRKNDNMLSSYASGLL
jgi:energy-coupling factor transporter ATP-binding protein EcfA2